MAVVFVVFVCGRFVMFESRIGVKRFIQSLSMSPYDWALNTGSMDCNKIAKTLNETFALSVNNGMTYDQVRRKMEVTMHSLKEFGAADMEAFWALSELLENVYGATKEFKAANYQK
jgi:hypothetical protein